MTEHYYITEYGFTKSSKKFNVWFGPDAQEVFRGLPINKMQWICALRNVSSINEYFPGMKFVVVTSPGFDEDDNVCLEANKVYIPANEETEMALKLMVL